MVSEKNYPVAEVNCILSKWCSVHNPKSHITVKCRIHIQSLKVQLKCFNCGDDQIVKDCPKPKKNKKENPQTSDQTPCVHTTFGTTAHIPIDIWPNINKLYS